MKKIYTIYEEGCVARELFKVTVDDNDVAETPVVPVAGDTHKIDIGDFTLDFGSKSVKIVVTDDVLEDFDEEYTISIGGELYEAIKQDLIDRGVDEETASNIAGNVEYTDATVRVTVSVRDEDVQIDRISEY